MWNYKIAMATSLVSRAKMASRFKKVTDEEVTEFKEAVENSNTRKSTINWWGLLTSGVTKIAFKKTFEMRQRQRVCNLRRKPDKNTATCRRFTGSAKVCTTQTVRNRCIAMSRGSFEELLVQEAWRFKIIWSVLLSVHRQPHHNRRMVQEESNG